MFLSYIWYLSMKAKIKMNKIRIFLFVATVLASTNASSYKIFEGRTTTLRWNFLKSEEGLESAEECQEYCEKNAEGGVCQLFQFSMPNDGNQSICLIVDHDRPYRPFGPQDRVLQAAPKEKWGEEMTTGYNNGNEMVLVKEAVSKYYFIDTVKVSDFTGCQNKCDEDSECYAFNFSSKLSADGEGYNCVKIGGGLEPEKGEDLSKNNVHTTAYKQKQI